MAALTWENADFAWDNELGLTWSDEEFSVIDPPPGNAVYPDPSQVAAGVKYGPNRDDYTGTMTSGGGAQVYFFRLQA